MNASKIFMTGIAIFSMFFGAGNVVFPLLLGTESGDQIGYALLGLLLTAIGGPLIGLASATLFEGDARKFFFRAGPVFGSIFMAFTLGLLGPFAVLPRCVVVSHAAMEAFIPGLNLLLFSLIFCLLAFVATMRQSKILPLLGYFLSPMLLCSLLAIIIAAFLNGGDLDPSLFSSFEAFKQGAFTGYDTMDLIAAIFFSTTIWHLLVRTFKVEGIPPKPKVILKTLLLSGLIGGGLLALMYTGLSYSCALNQEVLLGVPSATLMTKISFHLLGPIFGGIANLAVFLACFTTVISLTVTISDVLRSHFLPDGISYRVTVLANLGVTALLATLGFEVIMGVIHPVVSLCYPAIIVLALCNTAYVLWGFSWVKAPVALTLILTLIWAYA